MTYNYYHNLKNSLNSIRFFGFGNILIGDALTIDILYFFKEGKNNIKEKLKYLLSFISMSVSSKYEYSINRFGKPEDKTLLFYFSHIYENRRDYVDSINKIKSLFSCRTELIGKGTSRKIRFRNLKLLVLAPIWLFQLISIDCSFRFKMRVLHELLAIKPWYDYICREINPKKYSALIVYFDARSFDNIIVQYFKLNNIPTATLQHGHFVATPGNINISGIAFEGFISDKFLMWGEYSKNEAIKSGIDPKQIKTVGCPKYIGYSRKLNRNQMNLFGVVLDGQGNEFAGTNIEMIEIANIFAKQKNMKYVIKPHPVSDMSAFMDYIDKEYLFRITPKDETVVEYAESVDFSIVMGSSVYSELLYIGAVAFRFISNNTPDIYSGIDWGTMRNSDDLASLYELYKNNPKYVQDKVQQSANSLFEPGDTALNYKNVIYELVNTGIEMEFLNGI